MHALTRTSPMGGPFIGTCMKCGTPGLTIADMGKDCPNISGMTDEEALLLAISTPEDDEDKPCD